MEVTATQRLDWDQRWNFHPQVSHPIGVEDLVLSLKVCETRTHSQQQSKGPKLTKRSQQSDSQSESNALWPPKVPSLLALGLG